MLLLSFEHFTVLRHASSLVKMKEVDWFGRHFWRNGSRLEAEVGIKSPHTEYVVGPLNKVLAYRISRRSSYGSGRYWVYIQTARQSDRRLMLKQVIAFYITHIVFSFQLKQRRAELGRERERGGGLLKKKTRVNIICVQSKMVWNYFGVLPIF